MALIVVSADWITTASLPATLMRRELVASYADAMRELVEEFDDVGFLDLARRWSVEQGLYSQYAATMLADGVHNSIAGQDAWAAMFRSEIEEAAA